MKEEIYKFLQNFIVTPLIFILIFLFALMTYETVKYWNYFTKRRIKFIRGWPVLGSFHKYIFGQLSFPDFFTEMYQCYPNQKIIGFYNMWQPMYLLLDPELVKEIVVKDFVCFVNRSNDFNMLLDVMLTRGLAFLKDQKWKDMRATLTPVFSGSKMRLMHNLIIDSVDVLIDHLKINVPHDYELKELFSRLSNDIVASTAFGLKVNSLENRDNRFFKEAEKFTHVNGLKSFKMFLMYPNYPTLMKYLKYEIFESSCVNYFRDIIKTDIDYRQKHDIIRPDLINILIEARRVSNKDWDDDNILAQCLIFLFAGYETMSTLFSFMAYELGMNPDVQQRLYEEVKDIKKRTEDDESLSYDIIMKSTYMDMVVQEVLRLWPPAPFLQRQVGTDYTMIVDGNEIKLKRGEGVWFPIVGIHRDTKYYPDPLRFDPERFSDTNKSKINPSAYIPFGLGQRSCIGGRMAMMNCKIVFYKLLLDFVIEPCDRTQYPLKLKKRSLNMGGERGIWVKLRRRI